MQDVADQSAAPTTIGADLCAIFVSLELSRSTWLATSLSTGRGEKMSKHGVSAGDIAALLSVALGRSSLRSSGPKDSPDTSITADRSPLMPALPRRLGKAGRSIASRASRNRAIRDSGQR